MKDSTDSFYRKFRIKIQHLSIDSICNLFIFNKINLKIRKCFINIKLDSHENSFKLKEVFANKGSTPYRLNFL